MRHRSAPAKALEERQYRQRVLEHITDDDDWREDLKEYYGTRRLGPQATTEENQTTDKSMAQYLSNEDRRDDAELVETRKKRR
jgi:hypothetical protein